MTTETDTPQKPRFPIVPLIIVAAASVGIFEFVIWGQEKKRQNEIHEFYNNFKVDTVRDAHGAVDMEQSGVFVPLKKLDSMRLILQKD